MGVNKININSNDSNYAHSIFDISEYTGKSYASISDALADVPQGKQKGGMTVSFVLDSESDNKYVQYRLMTDSFNTTETNWINLNPTQDIQNDENSVPSNAVVYKALSSLSNNIINPNTILTGKYISSSGNIANTESDNWSVSDFILVNGQDISIHGVAGKGSAIRCYVVYAADKTTILEVSPEGGSSHYTYNAQRGDSYIVIGLKTEMITEDYPTYFANYGSTLLSYEPYSVIFGLDELNQIIIDKINSNEEKNIEDKTKIFSLLKKKLDNKPVGKNLVDKKAIESPYYITGSGVIAPASANFGVTDYIPVNGTNIISNADKNNTRGSFNVYDSDYKYLRTIHGTGSDYQQYTYQDGDAFVRISFNGTNYCYANYGDTLYLEEYLNDIDNIYNLLFVSILSSSTNIINPNNISTGKYISSYGTIGTTEESGWGVSDYIPINGHDISIHGMAGTGSAVRCYVVYAEDKSTILEVSPVGGSEHYTYNAQRGDAFIIIGLKNISMITEDYPTFFANYGSTLLSYEPYSTSGIEGYKTMQEVFETLLGMDSQITELQQEVGTDSDDVLDFNSVSVISTPKTLYAVWNDKNVNRNYFNKLYVDHLIYNLSKWNCDFGFTIPRVKSYPIIGFYDNIDPSDSTSKNVVQISENVNLVSGKYKTPITIVKKITKTSVGINSKPKLLCIGDSVTAGAGAHYQKLDNTPAEYWSWVTWLFANDKKDNNGNGFDFVSVGTAPINSIFGITDQFTLDGVTYKSFATAKGGWALDDLNQPNHEGSGVNPFYDSALGRFSFAYYLANFRTMDDNGNRLYFDANQSTTGTAGQSNVGYLADGTIAKDANNNTLYIGYQITDTESMNICKPTHIVINLNHNTAYSNYISVLPNIISDIKTVVPDAFIILMSIDSTGTFAPALYPEIPYNFAKMDTGLHNKNCSIYNYQATLENVENKIYVCSGNLVQPPVDVIRGVFSQQVDYIGMDNYAEFGISPTYPFSPVSYHPNNLAHRGWGYQLYALIKYTLSL